ncbi:MAG: cyclic nucleotide-binding and patatin-like phospholipase domain-containing protein [Pseudomonadota bacterium]
MDILEDNRKQEMIERHFGIVGADAEALLAELTPIDVHGGDWLFHQGDLATAMYLLVRGRLQVWIEPEDGDGSKPDLVAEVSAGDCVGEIGLLTRGKRTAGVRAIRDSHLLKLDKDAFEHFAEAHPGLGLRLASSIALTLTERTRSGNRGTRNLTTVALMPLTESALADNFLERLTKSMHRRADSLCLTSDNLKGHGAPAELPDDGGAVPEALQDWLADLESDQRLLVYVADPADTAWSRLCIRQADLICLLADGTDDPRPRDFENALLNQAGAESTRRALLLRQPDTDAPITNTLAWLEPRRLEFHLHLKRGHQEEVERTARLLLGEACGLVLGGGAARGFAEIGAYKALHEARIPIDWIGGTSIGGIIGAAIALDRGPDFVIASARDAFVRGKPFGDFTLPITSLLRGRRMERLTENYLGGEIEDLPIPFYCVSTRLDDGEQYIHERGTIWRALRATAALPGMLPPAVIAQRLVVDGAVINNLPVDIMQKKPVGRVIAVDVSTQRTYTVDYQDVPSPWSLLGRRMLPGVRSHRVPGVISILMKSAEIGNAARMRQHAADADLLLRPPVAGFGLTDVRRYDDIVEAGYRHTSEALDSWLSRSERETPNAR